MCVYIYVCVYMYIYTHTHIYICLCPWLLLTFGIWSWFLTQGSRDPCHFLSGRSG